MEPGWVSDMRNEEANGVVATDYSVTSMMHDDLNSSAMRVKSGYAGHLPGARDTWGMTHYDTINMGADGRLHGRSRFVHDGNATNQFTNEFDGKGQQKQYHDDLDRALHEH